MKASSYYALFQTIQLGGTNSLISILATTRKMLEFSQR